MKCFVAKQIPMEAQEPELYAPWGYDNWEGLYVFGNKCFEEHICPEMNDVIQFMDNAITDYETLKDDPANAWYGSLADLVDGIFSYAAPYNEQEVAAWEDILDHWDSSNDVRGRDNLDLLADALSIMKRKPYTIKRIHGSCQGDVQYVFYCPSDYSDKEIRYFECEYWNEGSEWKVSYMVDVPDDASVETLVAASEEEDDQGCIYCHEWGTEPIKQEIADFMGISADNLVLLSHDGYKQVSKYKLA